MQRKRGVDHAVCIQQRFDIGTVEHNGGRLPRSVRQVAREVVLARSHRAMIRQRHIRRHEARHRVFLAKRCQQVQLAHVFQRKLCQTHARIHRNGRVKRRRRQLVHERAQAAREFFQVRHGKRHAHSRFMPTVTCEQIGAAFDGLEQIHATNAATRAACFIAIDSQQNRGHAIRSHQATCHNSLHALVPASARNHQRALAVVDFLGLHLRNFG